MNHVAILAATAALLLYTAIRLGLVAADSHASLREIMGTPSRIEALLLLTGCAAATALALRAVL